RGTPFCSWIGRPSGKTSVNRAAKSVSTTLEPTYRTSRSGPTTSAGLVHDGDDAAAACRCRVLRVTGVGVGAERPAGSRAPNTPREWRYTSIVSTPAGGQASAARHRLRSSTRSSPTEPSARPGAPADLVASSTLYLQQAEAEERERSRHDDGSGTRGRARS